MSYRIDRRLRDAIYRTDFSTFVGKCFHTLEPGSAYQMNWHILALALKWCGSARSDDLLLTCRRVR
jgi:hypothetical protein